MRPTKDVLYQLSYIGFFDRLIDGMEENITILDTPTILR